MNQSILENLDRLGNVYRSNVEFFFNHQEKSFSFFKGEPFKEDHYKGISEFEVIYSLNGIRVFRFITPRKKTGLPPIFLVPSLINRSYIMDLMDENSLVQALTRAGYPVYLIDWGVFGPQHDHLPFSFFVDDMISRATDEILADTKSDKVALLGYCMAGTMVLMHTALHPDRVSHLTLLASPVQFHDDGILSKWAQPEIFPIEDLMDTMDHMDATMLQSSFLMMKPLSYFQKIKSAYEGCLNPRFFNGFVHLESWVNDNTSVSGTAYKEYVKLCYHEDAVVEGIFSVSGKTVDLRDISCPILNIMALKDHIVPPESSRIIDKLVSVPVTDIEIDAGHIGVIMGRKAQKMYESVISFHS